MNGLNLIYNIALIVSLLVIYQFVVRSLGHRSIRQQFLSGLLFGVVGVIGMMTPLHFLPGVIFDGRSIILGVAGLFGGPITAIVAAIICAVYRLHLGGGGALMGVLVITEATLIGIGFHYFKRSYPYLINTISLYIFSLSIHIIMVALMLTLPKSDQADTFRNIAPWILTIYPFAMLLLCKVFLLNEEWTETRLALKSSEERHRAVVEQAGDGYELLDENGIYIDVNIATCRQLGYERDELIGKRISDIDSRVKPEHFQEVLQSQAGKPPITFESVKRRKDGTEFPVEITRSVINLKGSKCVLSIVRNITHRKLLEAKQGALLDLLPDIAWLKDMDGKHVSVNKKFLEFTGKPISEIIGKTDEELWGVQLSEEYLSSDRMVIESGDYIKVEETLLDYKGDTFVTEVIKVPFKNENGDVIGVAGSARDISERKLAEEALRESEEKLRKSQEIAKLGSWVCDIEGNIIWTDVMYRIYGVSQDTFVPNAKSYINLIHSDDQPLMNEWIRACVAGEKPEELEFRCVHPDGAVHWIRGAGELICDEEGNPIYMSGTAQDITERKLAEQSIKDSDDRLRSITNSAKEAIITADSTGIIVGWNPCASSMFGISEERAIGSPLTILMPERYHELQLAGVNRVVSGSEKRIIGQIVELEGTRSDGSEFPVEISIAEWKSRGELYFTAMIRDITTRKQAESEKQALEEKLAQSQRLEAVGLLAGGIAHDFNNLLTGIIGYCELLKAEFIGNKAVTGDLQQIFNAAQRAAELTSGLLAFSRKQIIRPQNIDLNQAISKITRLLSRVIGETIKLDIKPGHNLGTTFVDPGQIEHVIMNLAINARDAMPDGGNLTIETENVVINGEYVKLHPWATPGRYVLISITDTGVGIPKENIDKVFTPFFTTKEIGKGTGLGPSTAYGVIKQHNGMVNVYSEVGKGTTIKLYLPIVERPAENVGMKIESKVLGGNETILIAEDDKIVLGLATRLLSRAGYNVLVAHDGLEAVQIFNENIDAIDLIILDIVMPELGGLETYKSMSQLAPEKKFLFCSGYSSETKPLEEAVQSGIQIVSKPYNPDGLLKAIRDLLDKPSKQ